MSDDDFASKSMWEYLADGMIKNWPSLQDKSKNTVFQFTGQPVPAIWTSGLDYGAWTLANIVPANLDGYYIQSTNLVARAYKDFISSIAPSNFQRNAQYQQYQVELSNLADLYKTTVADAENSYNQFVERYPNISEGMGYFTWLSKGGTAGPSYSLKFSNIESQQAVVTSEIGEFMKSVDFSLSEAQLAVNDLTNLQKFSFGGVSQEGLVTSLDELTSYRAKWANRPAGSAPDLNVTINKDTVQKGSWHKVVHTSVKRKCLSISTHTDIDTSRVLLDTKFSINIQAVGANTFRINRGSWFDASWLSASNVRFPEGSRFTMNDFFGENGSLHLVPTRALVIYKPKVTITISTETYTQTVQKSFDASASISLFGANFSLAAGVKNIVKDGPENTKVITLDSYSGVEASPLLFGMSSQSFYKE
ncbi:MAG: hypothetical protein ACI8ZO_000590 [Flavobacteriales bacterium]|jgi:hypothetical protein